MDITTEMIQRFKPIIYVPKEPQNWYFRKDVLCEIFPVFIVLWYHWPRDDGTPKADYEPIILVFKNKSLAAIGRRPHEDYKYTIKWMTEGSRPVIVFHSPWHAPLISKGSLTDMVPVIYMSSVLSDKITNYNIVYRTPPPWYIKDGTDTAVYDYAQWIANNIQ